MAIRTEKTFEVQEPLEHVWKFISDPRKVVNCLPGAQITEAVDDRTFKGVIKVQVGPSVTAYNGQVQIERLDDQKHEIEFSGQRGGHPRQGQRIGEDDRKGPIASERKHRSRERCGSQCGGSARTDGRPHDPGGVQSDIRCLQLEYCRSTAARESCVE